MNNEFKATIIGILVGSAVTLAAGSMIYSARTHAQRKETSAMIKETNQNINKVYQILSKGHEGIKFTGEVYHDAPPCGPNLKCDFYRNEAGKPVECWVDGKLKCAGEK